MIPTVTEYLLYYNKLSIKERDFFDLCVEEINKTLRRYNDIVPVYVVCEGKPSSNVIESLGHLLRYKGWTFDISVSQWVNTIYQEIDPNYFSVKISLDINSKS